MRRASPSASVASPSMTRYRLGIVVARQQVIDDRPEPNQPATHARTLDMKRQDIIFQRADKFAALSLVPLTLAPPSSGSSHSLRLQTPCQDRPLRMHPVLRFLEHHGLRPIDNLCPSPRYSRCAGRQCMNIACGAARLISAGIPPDSPAAVSCAARRLHGPSTPTHPSPRNRRPRSRFVRVLTE